MPGYTITTVVGDDWLPVGGRLGAALVPRSRGTEMVPGDGDLAFRCGQATVTLSWELPGTWYADVEGDVAVEEADAIIAEVTQQLGEATGQQAQFCRVADE